MQIQFCEIQHTPEQLLLGAATVDSIYIRPIYPKHNSVQISLGTAVVESKHFWYIYIEDNLVHILFGTKSFYNMDIFF